MLIPSRMGEILGEHRGIVDALRARDGDTAERLANEHHEVTARRLLASIERKNR
jgi:DNA-binding GntR family transcriptional regulator